MILCKNKFKGLVVEKVIVVFSQGGDGVLRFGKKVLKRVHKVSRRVLFLNVSIEENFEL